MNTEVSPVTREEAQTFFQRIATMAVGYSAQANQINNLGSEIKALGERLEAIRQEADKLKAEVAETWEFAHRMEAERDAAKAATERVEAELSTTVEQHAQARQDYETRLSQAHDAMLARDQRIAELEAQLASSRAETVAIQEANAANVRELEQTRQNRDYWQGEANSARDRLVTSRESYNELGQRYEVARAQLASVQAKLTELRSVFEPSQAEQPSASAA